MAHDTTHDAEPIEGTISEDTAPDATHDSTSDSAPEPAYVVTITEAARLTTWSVRTIQRKLDKKPEPELQAVTMAGKRCVVLPVALVAPGVKIDTAQILAHDTTGDRSATLDSTSLKTSRDTTGDTEHDTAAIVPVRGGGVEVLAMFAQAIADSIESRTSVQETAAKLVLSLDECRTLTGFSQGTLKAAISAGELKAQKIGRGWKVKRSDLERFVEGL